MANNYFKNPIKGFELPITRAAYSDRTAWIMAEMSAIAYIRFEGEEILQEQIYAITKSIKRAYKIKSLFTKKKGESVLKKITELENKLKKYIDEKTLEKKFQPPAKTSLEKYLEEAKFKLIETFNLNDTQAFLASREDDKTAVLAFRGTEASQWGDVKTDIKAWTKNSADGTKIHTGFADAFEPVEEGIKTAVLNSCKEHSLYITGHSLGGALAIIATEKLEKTGVKIAACYTFGSPRVGNQEFGEKIKAPVYRLVNAADGVPRIPPSGEVMRLIIFILGFTRVLKPFAHLLQKKFSGYKHYGDMRYLTACNSEMSNLKLLENPGWIDRSRRFFRRWMTHNLFISGKDHGIDHYRNKLHHYAEQRNK